MKGRPAPAQAQLQVCSQQVPVQICPEPQLVGTLPQHYAQKPLPPNWQNCGCVLTPVTHPHLANLLEHKQTATWHNPITDRHANVQYTPRCRCVMDTITCTGTLFRNCWSTQVCVYRRYSQMHALSHTQGPHRRQLNPPAHRSSLSTGTSTSLAQSRDPGCPGHTKQTQRQWNGTFNCL